MKCLEGCMELHMLYTGNFIGQQGKLMQMLSKEYRHPAFSEQEQDNQLDEIVLVLAYGSSYHIKDRFGRGRIQLADELWTSTTIFLLRTTT